MSGSVSTSMAVPSSLSSISLTTLKLSMVSGGVLHVALSYGSVNSMPRAFWKEMVLLFEAIGQESTVRVVIISGGNSRIFSAGLDLMDHANTFTGGAASSSSSSSDSSSSTSTPDDVGRRFFQLRQFVLAYQQTFSVFERIPQPVIVAVHGACVGGGLDLVTACDIRLCSSDASFVLKEVDIGIVADVGVIQRLRKIVGNASIVAEMAYTAKPLKANDALALGLVSSVHPTKNDVWNAAVALAQEIASKSPVAVAGIKHCLLHARDHNVHDSLNYVATLNGALIQSGDVGVAIQAGLSKSKPIYSNL